MSWNYSWYNFADISLWSDYGTNKSIYDPCPYGYRVPKGGEGAASSWYGFTGSTWTNGDITGGAVWSSTWWPAAGRRDYSSGTITDVGYRGWCWSSTRHSKVSKSYNLFFDDVGIVYPNYSIDRSSAMSVRCVQERRPTPPSQQILFGGKTKICSFVTLQSHFFLQKDPL